MQPDRITQIVIVGGGTAGWMAAAGLAKSLESRDIGITLVESPDVPTVGVGEATLPGIRDFNAHLDIDEVDFLRKTQATFKLGIEFRDWSEQGARFFHPFADYGVPLSGIEFHQCFNRARETEPGLRLADHNLPIALAGQNRFAQPHPDPEHPLADFKYAFQFDAILYAGYLRDYSTAAGVTHVQDRVVDVLLDPEHGFISEIRLESGQGLAGELFVDCTGFGGLLIEKALATGYEEWTHWLPVDRALAVGSVSTPNPAPYTVSAARPGGWQWRIPLQHRIGNGYVYSSQYCSDDEAHETLLANLPSEALGEPKPLRFTTGIRKKFWNRNCVALGLSSGFLEPLESTSISLIQTGISKLLKFFPDRGFHGPDIDEANRIARLEMERIRDFLILHYCANRRNSGELWEYCRNMALPDPLRHKIDVFRHRGHLVEYDVESFRLASWLSIFYGMGWTPAHCDVRAAGLPAAELSSALKNIRNTVAAAATAAPLQSEFIAKHCAAPAA